MSKKDLILTPTNMKKLGGVEPIRDAWFYEDNAGLYIVIDGVGQYMISWRLIRPALKRKDRP